MLVNHSGLNEFDDFDNRYSAELCQRYNHLNHFRIHCYSIDDYKYLAEAIPLNGFENDSFGFAIDNKEGKYSSTSAYIIYSPKICLKLKLSSEEIYACIAHEVGHIIHHFNENLKGANSTFIEIKADEIAKSLGISSHLSSALSKLIDSNLYSEEQCVGMNYRRKLLNNTYQSNEGKQLSPG